MKKKVKTWKEQCEETQWKVWSMAHESEIEVAACDTGINWLRG